MLAITLLPFSILGPFVGVVLDRVARRQVLVVVDLLRAGLAVGLAALVATGLRTGATETVFYGGVLLAMSLNRFLLAALSASLPHTIDVQRVHGGQLGGAHGRPGGRADRGRPRHGLRLVLGRVMPDYSANAILFVVAAGGFVLSASLALRIPRRQLGPDEPEPTRASDVVAGLAAALAHLRERRPAALGLLTIGGHRIIYGIVTVATILVYRNYFHTLDQVEPAIADLGLLVVVTGAGFVFAAVVTPPVAARLGIRRWIIVCLVASAVFQIFPGAIYAKVPLGIAAFLLGLTAQNIKICVDTLVQAHVDDEFKGRVFVLYDMVFNVALVLAAVVGAVILPADGMSVSILVVLAVGYLLVAALVRVRQPRPGHEPGHRVADRRRGPRLTHRRRRAPAALTASVGIRRADGDDLALGGPAGRPAPGVPAVLRPGACDDGSQVSGLTSHRPADHAQLDFPSAHQARSSSRARSWPSGPSSIRRSSSQLVRPADVAARRDAEDGHDLVAVQVRAQRRPAPPARRARRSAAPGRRTRTAAPPPAPGSASCSRRGSGCAAAPAGHRRPGRSGGRRSRSTPPRRRDGRRSRGTAGAARPGSTTALTTSLLNRRAVSRFRASFAPTTSWWWNDTFPPASNFRVAGLPMSCSSAASRLTRSGRAGTSTSSSVRSGSRNSSAIACSSTVRLCW